MSFRLLSQAFLALATGLALGVLGLRFISGPGEPPLEAPVNSFAPRLSLIRQANTGELISLQIGPFEVGRNDLRLSVLNPVGQQLELASAQVRISRMESGDAVAEADSIASGRARSSSISLPEPGWWQIDVIVKTGSTATFYLKLDQPSGAPESFAPPNYESDREAQQLFESALARHASLTGLKWREELTSGLPGPNSLGVWFITNIVASRGGYHATTVNLDQGGSELYSDTLRQCFRQSRDGWQCTDGPSPIGPFDLSYLRGANGFLMGRKEMVDGEMSQVILFYNPPQGVWYVWWIGEQTHYLRRQAMVGKGHFMLGSYRDQDVPVSIQPRDLPLSVRELENQR